MAAKQPDHWVNQPALYSQGRLSLEASKPRGFVENPNLVSSTLGWEHGSGRDKKRMYLMIIHQISLIEVSILLIVIWLKWQSIQSLLKYILSLNTAFFWTTVTLFLVSFMVFSHQQIRFVISTTGTQNFLQSSWENHKALECPSESCMNQTVMSRDCGSTLAPWLFKTNLVPLYY